LALRLPQPEKIDPQNRGDDQTGVEPIAESHSWT
jgi:hypothetical protein